MVYVEKNESIFKLLWGNDGEQIQRTETITDYQDFRESNKALKITWILQHLTDFKSKWKSFSTLYLSKVKGMIVFTCYSAKKYQSRLLFFTGGFWCRIHVKQLSY